jgi:RNA polymerase sigma-70 factor, ECF subfamily
MAFVLPDLDTENRLLSLAKRGDKRAVSEIYEQFFPSVYQFVRLHVEDKPTAEDIASEVFFKLVDTLGKRNGVQTTLRGWLFQVARNEIYKQYGKKHKMPTTTLNDWMPASDDVEADFIQRSGIESIRSALRKLPSEQQEILVLRFAESLSLEEAADFMGKSVSAIKSLQFRATDSLRRLLAQSSKAGATRGEGRGA